MCWLYAHNLEFRRAWGGDDTVTEIPLPATPGLLDCGKNIGKAVLRFASSGFKMVGNDIKNQRLAICQACPFLRGDRCGKCGCNLQYKAAWESEHCPIEKW